MHEQAATGKIMHAFKQVKDEVGIRLRIKPVIDPRNCNQGKKRSKMEFRKIEANADSTWGTMKAQKSGFILHLHSKG